MSKLEWVVVRASNKPSALPAAEDLGPGESEVLTLAMESSNPICILDDALARKAAETLGLRFTGTLGILLDAKRAGLIHEVCPALEMLDRLNFRVSAKTRAAVLRLTGEAR